MQAKAAYSPDWRDPAAYSPLLDADPSLVAWEWLRRDPAYRTAARRSIGAHRPVEGCSDPEHFGLVRFEPPDLGVPYARPLWHPDVHPLVLPVERAHPASELDEVDLERMHSLVTLAVGESGEHLLLSDGFRAIQLKGPPGTFSEGRASLKYLIAGLAGAERPVLTLRRFLACCRSGRFSRSLHCREARARRWIMLLRTRDALVAGATQRQIAGELLSRSTGLPQWRSRESSLRSQVQRLVRSARLMAAGNYGSLLR